MVSAAFDFLEQSAGTSSDAGGGAGPHGAWRPNPTARPGRVAFPRRFLWHIIERKLMDNEPAPDRNPRSGMSDEQFSEFMGEEMSKGKIFYYAGNLLGYGASEAHAPNFEEQRSRWLVRAMDSFKEGYHLEYLAITALLIEIELRVWMNACHGVKFKSESKFTLGQILNHAKSLGLNGGLSARIGQFVSLRNDFIHNAIMHAMPYDDLLIQIRQDPLVLPDTMKWVKMQLPRIGSIT